MSIPIVFEYFEKFVSRRKLKLPITFTQQFVLTEFTVSSIEPCTTHTRVEAITVYTGSTVKTSMIAGTLVFGDCNIHFAKRETPCAAIFFMYFVSYKTKWKSRERKKEKNKEENPTICIQNWRKWLSSFKSSLVWSWKSVEVIEFHAHWKSQSKISLQQSPSRGQN